MAIPCRRTYHDPESAEQKSGGGKEVVPVTRCQILGITASEDKEIITEQLQSPGRDLSQEWTHSSEGISDRVIDLIPEPHPFMENIEFDVDLASASVEMANIQLGSFEG